MAAIIVKYSRATIALSAGAVKTLAQVVAPTNQRLRVKAWSVSFDGASPTAVPGLVRLLRQTTAGTMSALTGVLAEKELSEAIQSTAQHTASAEPTAGDVLEQITVHPQGGFSQTYAYGDEPIIQGGGRMGIDANFAAVVNATVSITIEE